MGIGPRPYCDGYARRRSCQEVNEIRRGPSSRAASLTLSVDVDLAARDVREQLRRVEAPEGLLRNEQGIPDHGRRVLNFLEPLGRIPLRRVADLRQQTPLFRLPRQRQLVEDVQEAMVPAPLLLRLRLDALLPDRRFLLLFGR